MSCVSKKSRAAAGGARSAALHIALHVPDRLSVVQLVRNARQASSRVSAPQPGRAAQAARCQIGRTGSGGGFSQLQGAHASAGAAGAGAQACAACGADGDGGGGDDAGGGAGSWAQEAASSAAARMPPTRVRRSSLVFDDGMWIIYLEMVLVLALGGLIVWWTLPRKKRPPADKDESAHKRD